MSADAIASAHPIARGGDAAFEDFFRAEFPRLAAYCARLLGDVQGGRDSAQEALLRTWTRWSFVENRSAYAYLVATNVVRGEWRSRQRRRSVLALLVRERQGPDDTGNDTVTEAVFRLPAKLREPVLLHYYADLPVADVARLLGCPVGTVKRRLSDARGTLERNLRRTGGGNDG